MTDESTANDQRADQPASEASGEQSQSSEPTLRIKHKGQHVDLSGEEAVRLSQKGLNYEQKMANLKTQQASLEEKQGEVTQYQQFKAYLAANPEKAGQIEGIIRGNPTTFDTDGEPMNDPTEARLNAIEQGLVQMNQHQQQAYSHQAQSQADTQVREAIARSPLLQKSPDMAYLMLLREMANDQGQDLSVAAKVVEGQFNKLAGATPEAMEAVQHAQARYAAEGGGSGAPATATRAPEELTGNDLKRGGVRRAALEFLRQSST